MTAGADARLMRKALRLAARGEGRTSPNPMVGAVLVRDGVEVASGWHRAPGSDHAEADALRRAGDATGCDLYVNLEPCCHQDESKRTPPCVPLIVSAGVRRVVVGMIDPNPKVAGRGVGMLREAGVEVVTGTLGDECRRLNAAFAKWVVTGRPLVTIKMGVTLDGRVADRSGASRWVTSEASRARVQRLRSVSDAVVVGAGTAAADDPLLLPRGVRGGRKPLRVVLDAAASLPPASQLGRTARRHPVLLAAGDAADPGRVAALEDAGVTVVRVAVEGDDVDLAAVLDELGRRGVTSVLVEGGPRVVSSLLRARLADRLLLFYAPRVLADPGAPSFTADLGIRRLDDALGFAVAGVDRVGPDVLVSLERQG
jgi:diaminohydroxyphosphoribosylaminopyrimidine deaminase/5-amino-6-(5-phosphoribosylamino)uracil reductase